MHYNLIRHLLYLHLSSWSRTWPRMGFVFCTAFYQSANRLNWQNTEQTNFFSLLNNEIYLVSGSVNFIHHHHRSQLPSSTFLANSEYLLLVSMKYKTEAEETVTVNTDWRISLTRQCSVVSNHHGIGSCTHISHRLTHPIRHEIFRFIASALHL